MREVPKDLPEIYLVFFDHVCSNISAIFSDRNNGNLSFGKAQGGFSHHDLQGRISICSDNWYRSPLTLLSMEGKRVGNFENCV